MVILFFYNEWLAMFPEIFLVISVNLILLYGVICSTSPFFDYPLLMGNICWFSALLLIITFVLVFNNLLFDIFVFNNLLFFDSFGNQVKSFILLGSLCVLVMCLRYNRVELVNSFEFFLLVIIVILGILLFVSSCDLMSMYLAIELQSFCFYILSCFKRNSEFSAESGLKYFVLGAFSSGFLLFGCSLIYGFTGVTNYELISLLLVDYDFDCVYNSGTIVGIVFIFTSFLLKLSAAPFHFWSPDVYEGSPTTVTAFFAIVPKIALFVFFFRVFFDSFYVFFFSLQYFFFLSSIMSMIVGSFGAIWQVKIKRLLAYSSISHVGYMFMSFCCPCVETIYGVILYALVYMFMCVLSFCLVLSIRRNDNSKKLKYIEDVSTISRVNPSVGICFIVAFFSIAGIPPLAGFFGKMFLLFGAVSQSLYFLTFVAVSTSVVSCFYYLRIIQTTCFEQIFLWVSIKKVNKEMSFLVSFVTLFLIFFFVHPTLLTVLIHNCIFSLSI